MGCIRLSFSAMEQRHVGSSGSMTMVVPRGNGYYRAKGEGTRRTQMTRRVRYRSLHNSTWGRRSLPLSPCGLVQVTSTSLPILWSNCPANITHAVVKYVRDTFRVL